MLHRLVAIVGYPAHVLNRQLAPALARLRLGRVPGALVVAIASGALAISSGLDTLRAYDARPEPLETSVAEIVQGRLASGLWVEFDGVLLEGPHVASVEVIAGGRRSEVQRFHYLVVDPADRDRGMVVRARESITQLESASGPVHLDGTITEDVVSMRTLLDGWDPLATHGGVEISESRLIAYAFATPWREPSWILTGILGGIAALLLVGAFIRQPILRATARAATVAGSLPIAVGVHGELPTPRGPVRVPGTSARLERMDVADVARTQWRYWGAALGDVRREVEEAVREHGEGDRLVVHAAAGSLIWPIDRPSALQVVAGEAYLGLRRQPALRIRGDGADATLTFRDDASRDAALVALGRPSAGS